MIQTVKIKYGFRNATDAQVQFAGGAVLAGMSGNSEYPDPPVSMEVSRACIDAFAAAITGLQQRSITLDDDQLEELRGLVAAGRASSVSAFVKHAVGVALHDAAE